MTQPKLRRGVKPQLINRLSTTATITNPSRCPLPKRPNQDSPTGPANYHTKIPNNITKHFASSTVNNSSQSQVIHNYLNQTMPMTLRSSSVITRSIAAHRNDMNETIDGYKATRSQTLKNHLRHNNTIQKPITITKNSMNYNYSQNHGIITESAYKNLRNGSNKW